MKVKNYHVTWTIDLKAISAVEAARTALSIQRDPNSLATVFRVLDKKTGHRQEVDLEEELNNEQN